MEGLTYYLDMSVLKRLFGLCAGVQKEGSVLAFDYWTPDVLDHPVFKRFQVFFSDRLGYRRSNYTLFDLDFIRSMEDYHVKETTDVQKLEREFANTNRLARYENILPEQYAILIKGK
jgi:O-methyltransferase involved in polyketide biosynthesis